MGRLTAFRTDIYPRDPLTLAVDTTYDLAKARVLAWASQLAYEVEETAKLSAIFRNFGWDKAEVFRETPDAGPILDGIKGFVARMPGVAILAFAGTEPDSLRNWLTDVHFVTGNDGVSIGFSKACDAVRAVVERALERLNGLPLYITGHSLGGALAVVSASRLPDAIRDTICGVYTFGMPRPGNETFARRYHARPKANPAALSLGELTFRLHHGDDAVPTVAPRFVGARHVGHLLHCAHGGTFTELEEDVPGPETGDSASRPVLDTVREYFSSLWSQPLPGFPAEDATAEKLIAALPQFARDHLMDRYLWALEAPQIRPPPR